MKIAHIRQNCAELGEQYSIQHRPGNVENYWLMAGPHPIVKTRNKHALSAAIKSVWIGTVAGMVGQMKMEGAI